jgi:hypothetical protein
MSTLQAQSTTRSYPFLPSLGQQKSLESALKHVFLEQEEETRIQRARKIMGDMVSSLSDEELDVYLTEFQYLVIDWLNSYEQQVFNGLTLQQLLREE